MVLWESSRFRLDIKRDVTGDTFSILSTTSSKDAKHLFPRQEVAFLSWKLRVQDFLIHSGFINKAIVYGPVGWPSG